MYRTNKVSLIVGGRGVGKTDFTKRVMKSSHHSKQLVVDTFDNPPWRTMATHDDLHNNDSFPIIDVGMLKRWSAGRYRVAESNISITMANIMKYANNSLIIFEDATRYIGSKPSEEIKNFVLDSKQKNLDLIFVFHSLMSVPPDLVRWSDTLTLFKTNEGAPSKSKYPWGEIPIMMKKLRKSSNQYENLTIQLN